MGRRFVVKFDEEFTVEVEGRVAAMLAAPLAATRWSMPACSRICPPCSQSSWLLLGPAAGGAAFLWLVHFCWDTPRDVDVVDALSLYFLKGFGSLWKHD